MSPARRAAGPRLAARILALEAAAPGTGCPECRGIYFENQPRGRYYVEQAPICPRCGRDRRKGPNVVRFVEAPRPLHARANDTPPRRSEEQEPPREPREGSP